MLPKSADIVIIGGGVMGASTAYHLAKRGTRQVVLLEREAFFGQGSTGRCAGGIRHQFSTDVNIELSLKSLAMLETFEQETGQPVDVRWLGYLFLLSTEDELAQFQHNVTKQNAHGVPSEMWTTDQIARRVPLLNLEGIIGGAYCGRDGIADPSGAVNGYVAAARASGAQLFNNVQVTRIEVHAGSVEAVQTDQGRIATHIVVNAAGAWAGKIGELAGVELPILPERQQILVTTPIPNLPQDFPFVIDFHQRLYFHLEGGGLLTGQSIIGAPPTFSQAVDPDWTLQHMERAMARLPILESAGRLTEWAGLYEVTPDAHPIIGPIRSLPGFYVVAGFSGHGFMHGPIAGLLVAEQILDGAAHSVDISSLSFERFSTARTFREFNVV